MKTEDLKNVVALDLVPSRGEPNVKIIAAGPITKQPSTQPYRIVLAATETEFVVWTEYFHGFGGNSLSEALQHENVHSSFDHGNYYKPDELAEAMRKFAQRVNNNADYAESVYRELPQETYPSR